MTQFIRRSFSISSEIKRCIPWEIEGRAAGRPAAREKKIQEKLMILILSHGITSLFPQTNEACGKPLAGTAESISSAFQKSQCHKEATFGTVLCHIATNYLLYGSRLRHGQEDLQKTIRRSYGGFGRECGHMGSIYECHSQSSSSCRK